MVMFYYSLVVAEMCTASALISIGAVLGKTNPVHLILIALLEVSGFVLNKWLLQTLLRVSGLLRFRPSVFTSYAGHAMYSLLFVGNSLIMVLSNSRSSLWTASCSFTSLGPSLDSCWPGSCIGMDPSSGLKKRNLTAKQDSSPCWVSSRLYFPNVTAKWGL